MVPRQLEGMGESGAGWNAGDGDLHLEELVALALDAVVHDARELLLPDAQAAHADVVLDVFEGSLEAVQALGKLPEALLELLRRGGEGVNTQKHLSAGGERYDECGYDRT